MFHPYSSCLRPEGSMGFETESLPYGHNQTFDVSPPRVRRAKDKIGLPEGTLQLWSFMPCTSKKSYPLSLSNWKIWTECHIDRLTD